MRMAVAKCLRWTFLFLLSIKVFYADGADQICCPASLDNCFSNNPPFDELPLPQCPESLRISMKLFTRSDETDGQLIINATMIPSDFRGNLMTMFLVHGFMSNGETQWLHDIKNSILAMADCNVIIVGWYAGSSLSSSDYYQAASNTRTTGWQISLMARSLVNNGGSAQGRLYCVGHSLGAHVCGHAGQNFKFGRITGMDPAGPSFASKDWSVGLNPSCADLVDVIHSAGKASIGLGLVEKGLGTMKVLGHVDFYPNGGWSQPGCMLDPLSAPLTQSAKALINGSAIPAGDVGPTCNHGRAYNFYNESIRTPCFYTYQKCTSKDNLPSTCSRSDVVIQNMGFPANNYTARGIFYLKTNPKSPYCRGHADKNSAAFLTADNALIVMIFLGISIVALLSQRQLLVQ